MADSLNPIMSVVAITASRLPDLSIKNGQLIFIKDSQKVALDFNNKRTFYNQIVVLQTEHERTSLLAPISGLFYFVIENAVLWLYEQSWIQVTTPPEDIVFIGTTLPELGNSKTVYINKTDRQIFVWDDEFENYTVVADTTDSISNDDILKLFD